MENKEFITILVSIVVGVATILTSFVNIYLVYKQNDISKTLTELQHDENQPVFQILTTLELDSDDGKYGTEILTIKNVGGKTSQPSEVSVNVFFRITKSSLSDNVSLNFHILDYFYFNHSGNTGDDEVYYAFLQGNNRKYFDIYNDAISVISNEVPKTFYFIDKIITTKIEYVDIHSHTHTKYYINKKEVEYNKYDEIVKTVNSTQYSETLEKISFEKMKEYIDKE